MTFTIVSALHQQLESKTSIADALKTRLSELEQAVNQSEEASSLQKRLLGEVKEEYDEKLKVVCHAKNNRALFLLNVFTRLWKANVKHNS